MEKQAQGHEIATVRQGSPAGNAGVLVGDALLAIDSTPVLDEIDYQYLSCGSDAILTLLRHEQELSLVAHKTEEEALGLTFTQALMGPVRPCHNHCVFCFIDQMPKGLRRTLYVKDDDWRMSLAFGNYITLTNVSDDEFQRMLARKASPLYISVHATDPAVRTRMMGNPDAGRLMERLRALADAGLRFHAQVVLCPTLNDGEVLTKTLADLAALWPAAQSVALVPVGLTRHREGLAALAHYTPQSASDLLAALAAWQTSYLATLGTRFVFAADEFYCLSGKALPPAEAYEDYQQIENGVGLLRQLEEDYTYALEEPPTDVHPRRVTLACGVSAAPFLQQLLGPEPLPGVRLTVLPVANRFFGETVTVSGLLTGGDLLLALRGAEADEVLLAGCMLRDGERVFLDDMTVDELSREICIPITPVPVDGTALMLALAGQGGTS